MLIPIFSISTLIRLIKSFLSEKLLVGNFIVSFQNEVWW